MIIRSLLLAMPLALMLSSAALAQADDSLELLDIDKKQEPPRPIMRGGPITTISAAGMLIATFDSNADYSVDKLEYQTGYKAAFDRADADKNGRIGLAELELWREKAFGSRDATPGSMFFDTDYSQTTTRAEFHDAFERVFKLSDKDGNGVIAFTEIVRVVSPQAPQAKQKKEAPRFSDVGRRNPNSRR